jgi:cytochrome c-type biogenesis protein CcmH
MARSANARRKVAAMRALFLLFLHCLTLVSPIFAASPNDLDSRESRLATQLRCVVCQNQSVAESNAPLAADMRREIRSQLDSGHSDQQIVDFFEQRYGAFVHYSPPLRPSTWLLWGAPFLLLAAGLALLFTVLRRRSRKIQSGPLSGEQRDRARRLLEESSSS